VSIAVTQGLLDVHTSCSCQTGLCTSRVGVLLTLSVVSFKVLSFKRFVFQSVVIERLSIHDLEGVHTI
jgi:hypothetical protein